ncbi:MAG: hypothetical protein HYZ53_16040 [Planctomycetes bacterium]|nr:hypothetical protein [Planctomycetota bacterium]
MIRVKRVPKPKDFDAKCARPGCAWLEKHKQAARPRDYWSQFKPVLARGFRDLCGYAAMYCPVGSVDHYLSWHKHPEMAYDWDNYRFVEEWINKSKGTADKRVLDPYEVREGWFEVLLPSLQLVSTDRVPRSKRKRAEYTLTRLHLREDERIVRQRQTWMNLHREGKLTLEGLDVVAPQLAAAVRRKDAHREHRESHASTRHPS